MIAVLASAILFVMSLVYLLILVGLPYGSFIFNGKYRVAPGHIRLACVGEMCVLLFGLVIVLQAEALLPLWFAWPITKGLCFAFAGLLTVLSVLHLLSKSPNERAVMAPLCCAAAVCFYAVAFMT